MFVDLPPDIPYTKPMIVLAQNENSQQAAKTPQHAIGTCRVMENNRDTESGSATSISFAGEAVNYLFKFEKVRSDELDAKVTLRAAPKHGRLVNDSNGALTYTPESGFYGRDKVVANVDINGRHVEVVYFIYVVERGTQESGESIRRYCGPKGVRWKIS